MSRAPCRGWFLENYKSLPRAYLNHAPWGGEYRPETYAVLAYDHEFIHLYMNSADPLIRCIHREDNSGDIWLDSCMEFFFNPCPKKTDQYFNIEINPLRYMLLGYGDSRAAGFSRVSLDPAKYNGFCREILDKVPEDGEWDFLISVPYAFISDHSPGFTPSEKMRWRGNFQKCGEETKKPHYLMWSPSDTPAPDFHVPECFGDLFFE